MRCKCWSAKAEAVSASIHMNEVLEKLDTLLCNEEQKIS